jgi:uncharacterized protein YndB with AHSA1/START domain
MTSRILVALRAPGSPARAFRVFTEEVGDWWVESPLFRFTPRGPGRVAFEPPADGASGRFVEMLPTGKIFVIGEVTVWEPGHRLVFGWRQATFAPGQQTEVAVSFEPAGDETRVTVQHFGWDSVPPAHIARHAMPAAVFDRRHGEWWRTLLASMNTRVG